MSYDELRKGRLSQPQRIYSITTVTRNRCPIFLDLVTARLLVGELRLLHDSGEVSSLAWVLMPDHLHWLLQLGEERSLGSAVKALKARSARLINQASGQRGSIWQRAYFEHAIRTEEDVRQVARYIIANPLRAGLVDDVGQYSHWDCIWMTDKERGLGLG